MAVIQSVQTQTISGTGVNAVSGVDNTAAAAGNSETLNRVNETKN